MRAGDADEGGTSIITDGIGSYVNLNSALPTLQNYSTGTVSFIFKLNSSGDQAIVANADNSTDDTQMRLYVTESRCEFNYKYDGAELGLDNFARTADVTLDLNTIYRIIFVQDDTVGARIYLDGVELTTYTRQGIANAKWWNSASSLTDTLSLNALIRDPDVYYASNIDEVAIFPTALTQAQVTTLYKSSL
ncbi:MAG: LamG domain-containing protein, partial [Deltaproteobacteria bacterium]|nr:LamG domain-containing protein [Deltaproteobacteria bacterium]